MTKTDELLNTLTQLKTHEMQFQGNVEDLDQSLDKAIEVLEVPEEIADDLTDLYKLTSTINKVLVAASIVPPPVGPFANRTKRVVVELKGKLGKAKKSAVRFDRKVQPIRKKLKEADKVVHEAAGRLAQFQVLVVETRNALSKVDRCVQSRNVDRRQLDTFSNTSLPLAKSLDQSFVKANLMVKKADDAIDAVGKKARKLIPIEKGIDDVHKVLNEIRKMLAPIEDALSQKISVPYGVKVKVKGKWYEPWKWKVRTKTTYFKFTINQILKGIDSGIGAVNRLLEKNAMKVLKPLLKKVNVSLKIPNIPGLANLDKIFSSVNVSLNDYTRAMTNLSLELNKQIQMMRKFQGQIAKLHTLDLGPCKP